MQMMEWKDGLGVERKEAPPAQTSCSHQESLVLVSQCVSTRLVWCSCLLVLLSVRVWQLVLTGSSVEEIKLEAFDKDLDSDDFLGRCAVCETKLFNR